ncbi:hypothetical protein V8D89_001796 [Ganoderma adspersum]
MFLMPINDPLANAPPDKARVRREHLRSVPAGRNHDFGESDVDTRLSGCPVNNLFNFPDTWTHPLPECGGMSTLSTSGSSASSDSEVYYSTPPMLDHPPIGPLRNPGSSDFDALGMEGDQTEYKEELFSLDGGMDTPLRSLSRSLQGLEFGLSGTQATFAFATSSPYPSPCILSAYGPPPWQHMDSAATADVHYPASCLRYDYPAIDSQASPTVTTGESHSMIKIHQEVISHVHVDHGVPWLYNVSVGQGRTALLPVCAGINPSLLSMPIPRAADRCLEASLHGQEQPQEHHYHAAPAGALSPGSGMQMPGYPDGIPPSSSLPATTSGSPSYSSPHLGPTGPRKSTDKAHNGISSKKPATIQVKKKRKQSTEKVFDCLWPECNSSFARTNNLKAHEQGVHLRMRPHVCPFAGCEKAEKGFSRKYDLDAHIQKQHPYMAEHENMSRA